MCRALYFLGSLPEHFPIPNVQLYPLGEEIFHLEQFLVLLLLQLLFMTYSSAYVLLDPVLAHCTLFRVIYLFRATDTVNGHTLS